MELKKKAGWSALVVVVLAVIAGTVTIPEGLRKYKIFELFSGESPAKVETFQAFEVLPSRPGLTRPKAPSDADVDAGIYRKKQQ